MYFSVFTAITQQQLFRRTTFDGRFRQYLGENNDMSFF